MEIFDFFSLWGIQKKSVLGLPEKTNEDSSTNEIVVQTVQNILSSVLDTKIKNIEGEKWKII